MNSDTSSKQDLRKHMRALRKGLSEEQQCANASLVAKHLLDLEIYQRASAIGFYLASDGEVSLDEILKIAPNQGKACYLPRIHNGDADHGKMSFHLFDKHSELVENRFGILEPRADTPQIDARHLDLVLMPLVAYDDLGHRLGMGGGYYDRCFSNENADNIDQASASGPIRIGVAHSVQKCEHIPTDEWDVPLHAVVTELGYQPCRA